MLPIVLALASATPAAAPVVAPVATVAAADPAKLAVAMRITARLLPDGSYRRMMGGSFNALLEGTTANLSALPVRQLAGMAGLSDDRAKTLGPGTIREVMAILDPVFDQRMKMTTEAMMSAMVDQMSAMEPSLREGMAIAYANRFDAGQLAAIDAFFASPAGTAYAGEAMTIMADPAVMTRMQASMGKMMASMPAIMKASAAATAGLPPPKKPADLSAADKAKLAVLLGVEPGAIK